MFEIMGTIGMKHYSNGKRYPIVKAKCLSCGVEQEIIKQNAQKSNREQRTHCAHCVENAFHRMTNTRIWGIWQGLKQRAMNQLDKNYGGRGITVCDDWLTFTKFYEDMFSTYRDDLTIERVDVNKPYCKENCRWVTNMEQQSNKRTNRYLVYQGKQMHLAELVRQSGFSKMMLVMRLNRGMSADEAVKDCALSPYGKSQRPVNTRRRERRMSMTS